MKRYKITHKTHYAFSSPVQLLPHTLRVRPREGHDLRIEASKLDISPAATLRWQRDIEGNSLSIAFFNNEAPELNILSEITIQKFDSSPHDFLLDEYAVNYPFSYQANDKILLMAYMNFEQKSANNFLDNWLSELWQSSHKIQSFDLLLQLNQRIYQQIAYCMREEEGVQNSEFTLKNKSGSCRDLAALFMAAAQRLGFSARFVSGYIYTNNSNPLSGATHAWAEVFLPGAGWKGFDPTIGNIVGTEHIAVAVARLPESIPPISGAFWGLARGKMTVTVLVEEV